MEYRRILLDGNVVEVYRDGDALVALVTPVGPACHTGERSCFHRGDFEPAAPHEALPVLERTIASRAAERPPGSYTVVLLEDPARIGAKVSSEAGESRNTPPMRCRLSLKADSSDAGGSPSNNGTCGSGRSTPGRLARIEVRISSRLLIASLPGSRGTSYGMSASVDAAPRGAFPRHSGRCR